MNTEVFNHIKRSDSLFASLLVPMILTAAVGMVAVFLIVPMLTENTIASETVRNAEQSVRQYQKTRNYYIDNVVMKVLSNSKLASAVDHKDNRSAIPAPETMIHELTTELSTDRTSARFYSPFPFAKRKNRSMDDFANRAWQFFKSSPESPFVETVNTGGVTRVRVAFADVMSSETCVNCHNAIKTSPKHDWLVGDMGGVFELNIDITDQLAASRLLLNQILFMGFLVITAILFVVARAFKKKVLIPLAEVNDIASKLSEGDLVTHEEALSSDELGLLRGSFRMTKAKLAVVINSIRSGAHSVAEAADQVSQGNSNLSQRTQEQASSLEEIASTMEQMTETVGQNADHAATAKSLVVKVNEDAKKSLVVVSSTIGAMASIEKSSKQIGDIISVIENIAFQTNLLALNAAVEAARAGEQGRGFAVVASEVRELAGRSAKAAKEIKELVNDSVGKVEAGSELIEETGEALSEISTAVENITIIVSEIAAASKEQSEGIGQVNKAISQMDEMTQSNASLVEEAAAASEALGAQSEELTSLVAYFKLNDVIDGVIEHNQDKKVETVRRINQPATRSSLPTKARENAPPDDDEWKDF